jgi:phage head maturation protease
MTGGTMTGTLTLTAAPMIVRAVAGELSLEGRTVEGVVVPYGVEAEVADEHGPAPIYREVFTATSFARQLQGFAARPDLVRRVEFNLDHRRELDRQIGYTSDVTSTDDGLIARFALYPTANLEQVRAMLTESHKSLSVECLLHRSRIRPDGVVERRVVELRGVAATPAGAYAGAGITAMRGVVDDDDQFGRRPTPMLDAVREAWGFVD